MSKKSRRRNKKLLALLALAGGAAMAGRGAKGMSGKETISDAQKAHNFASDAPVVADTATVAAPPKKVDLGHTRLTRDGVTPGIHIQNKLKTAGNRVPPSMRGGALHAEGYTPRHIGVGTGRVNWRAKGGSAYKKGGRVTGIAKRGFGRALMKGKK